MPPQHQHNKINALQIRDILSQRSAWVDDDNFKSTQMVISMLLCEIYGAEEKF